MINFIRLLDKNQLSGEIPDELSSLTKLEFLCVIVFNIQPIF